MFQEDSITLEKGSGKYKVSNNQIKKTIKYASFLRRVRFWTLKGPEGHQPQLC